jgi:hypothetical protein
MCIEMFIWKKMINFIQAKPQAIQPKLELSENFPATIIMRPVDNGTVPEGKQSKERCALSLDRLNL